MDFCKRRRFFCFNQKKNKFSLEIEKGMHHLQTGKKEFEIIHQDLATRNILLKKGKIAAINDFGMTKIKSIKEEILVTNQEIGPIRWMSPESLQNQEYSTKSDIFSYGVVLYEIVSRKIPFEGLTLIAVSHKILLGERMEIPENCPKILKELMISCWQHDPINRPDFLTIINELKIQSNN